MLDKIRKAEFSFPASPAVTPELKELIKGMLRLKPTDRLTVSAVKEHPWTKAGAAEAAPSSYPVASIQWPTDLREFANSAPLFFLLSWCGSLPFLPCVANRSAVGEHWPGFSQ